MTKVQLPQAMMIIEVVEFKDSWKLDFNSERLLLYSALSSLNPIIHHIGSTSVDGLAAKPIIDILIEVDDLPALDQLNSKLEAIGYVAKGEFGIPGRRYFQKGDMLRRHQIHAFEKESHGAKRHLAFRDYLIHHPHVAIDYATLKKSVARTCNNDIKLYCDGKDEFVKHHESLALKWYELNKSAHRTP